MFPKQHRLPAPEIKNVLRSKNRVSGKEFQIIYCPRLDSGNPSDPRNLSSRFAVIVSNKIDKRATARNRIKRLVRESIRHLIPRIAPVIDCVILARSNLGNKKQREVEQLLAKLFDV